MSEVYQWSTVAGQNNDAPPNGWPEGMLRADVNDTAREMMAAIARWYQGFPGSNPSNSGEWIARFGSSDQTPPLIVSVEADEITVRLIDTFFLGDALPLGTRVRVQQDSPGGTNHQDGFVRDVTVDAGPGDMLVGIDLDPDGNNGSGTRDNLLDATPDALVITELDPANGTILATGTPFAGLKVNDRIRLEMTQAGSANDGLVLDVLAINGNNEIEVAAGLLTTESANGYVYQEFATLINTINNFLVFHSNTGDPGTHPQFSSAWRQVGIGAGDLPSMSHLGNGVLLDMGPGGGINADTVDGQHAADLGNGSARRPTVYNPSFTVNQRAAIPSYNILNAGNSDGSMTLDRWRYLSNGVDLADIYQESNDYPLGGQGAIRFDTVTTGVYGLFQHIVPFDAREFVGRKVVMNISAKAAGPNMIGAHLRYAVIQSNVASGTIPNRDPIGTWGITAVLHPDWTYVGGSSPEQFTPISSGVPGLTANWEEDFYGPAVEVAVGTTWLGVLIYLEPLTTAVGDQLFLTDIDIYPGQDFVGIGNRRLDFFGELERCQAFYESSFGYGTPARHNQGQTAGCHVWQTADRNNASTSVRFRRPKWNPQSVVFGYNPFAGPGAVADGNFCGRMTGSVSQFPILITSQAGNFFTVQSAHNADPPGVDGFIIAGTAGSAATGDQFLLHWTASDEPGGEL